MTSSVSLTDSERDLLQALDEHDLLVHRCADGELEFWDFEVRYDAFYARYPLDGHDSRPERAVLEKHERRIALHREIWEQVMTKVTRAELAPRSMDGAMTFITAAEATERLKEIVQKHQR